MSKPGPTGKPVELKLLEGNRGHRTSDLNQMFRPETGLPPFPKDLSPAARKVWKRLAPQLVRYNLLAAIFSDTFEDLCETLADVKTLRRSMRARQALMREQGKDESEAWQTQTPNGMAMQHPLALNLRNARIDAQRLLDKFGLNPAEQASVTTTIRAQLHLFDGRGQVGDKDEATAEPAGFAEFE